MVVRLRAPLACLLVCALLAPFAGGGSPSEARSGALRSLTVASAIPPARIPIAEPPRIKRNFPRPETIRPTVVTATHTSGIRMSGPPMLRPHELIAVSHRARSLIAPPRPHAVGTPIRTPIVGPPARPGHNLAPASVPTPTATLPPTGTGINPWWRYQEQNVPGGGHVMVNIGTGNLLLQDDDMTVPHKGIAMAFRRTYNSQSLHDMNGSDGSWPSLYGNGWTNTFDAHVVRLGNGRFSVFDIDGARYEYGPVDTSNWLAGFNSLTPGQHAIFAYDGNCGFTWTKKTGTTYYFYLANPAATCSALATMGAYAGRLYQVVGRNTNTFITFTYSWVNGNAAAGGVPSQIVATTESGMTTTLTFGSVNGHQLLSTITFPDNATTVFYGYDGSGDLTSVSLPPNNAAGTRPLQSYGYQTVGSAQVLNWAASPRWYGGCSSGGCGTDGGYLSFGYAGATATASTLNWIGHYTLANPTIPDGTNTPLQSGYSTAAFADRNEYYTTGVGTPTFRDTDGHMTNWVVDGSGRPTQTQECTASISQGQQCTGIWLVTGESWDASSNRTSTVDARGYETDFAFDANGNALMEAQPISVMTSGTFRPTSWYAYDASSNIVAFCDAHATHQLGADWTSGTTAASNPCTSSTTQAHRFAYAYPAEEPYGQLSVATEPSTVSAPGGYARMYGYQSGSSDFGLPISVTGVAFAQDDGTQMSPSQTFGYDAAGNLTAYNTGSGSWTLAYDSLGRLTASTDLDGVTAHKTYGPDGSLALQQSAAQYAAGIGVAFTYDLDGNQTTEAHNFANIASVTTKWYDGAGRLAEVMEPQDGNAKTASHDYYAFPWLTRYVYDLSGSGTAAGGAPYNGQGTIQGYGNLVVTRTFVPNSPVPVAGVQAPLPKSYAQWRDVRATAFDALDRKTASYEAAFGTQAKETLLYDGAGSDGASVAGQLREMDRASGEAIRYRYDPRAKVTNRDYGGGSNTTSNYSASYDENGNLTQRGTVAFPGETLTYDAMNRLTADTEPTNSTHATLSRTYYPNGMMNTFGLTTATQASPALYALSYRADGKRQTLRLESNQRFAWTYSAAGRPQSQSDPFTGSSIQLDSPGSGYSPPLAPVQFTYDGYGRLVSKTLPQGGIYGQFTYDGEDSVGDYGVTSGLTAYEVCLHRTVRNEAYADTTYVKVSTPSNSQCAAQPPVFDMANGTRIGGGWTSGPTTMLVDPRNDMALATFDYPSVSYDGAGRQAVTQSSASYFDPTSGLPTTATGARTQNFDAENHVQHIGYSGQFYDSNQAGFVSGVSGTSASPLPYETYAYGPNGHPIVQTVVSSASSPVTANWSWDGDTFLYATYGTAPNAPSYINIQDLGVYDFSRHAMAWVSWRDWHGGLVGGHSNTCYDPWTENGSVIRRKGTPSTIIALGSPGQDPGDPRTATPPTTHYCAESGPPTNAGMSNSNGDGYSDGWTTFQGVRTYDAGIAQWTAPDAYAGNVHDPMSQQPFMWNRNNPFSYSDPSGYDAEVSQRGADVSITLHVNFDAGISDAQKQSIMSSIGKAWSGQFGQYNVTTTVVEDKDDAVSPLTNFLHLTNLDPNSSAGRAGTLYWNTTTASQQLIGKDSNYVFAHEAGHWMRLPDNYNTYGTFKPDAGYEHNIMGAYNQWGITEGQISSIIQNNASTGLGYYDGAP